MPLALADVSAMELYAMTGYVKTVYKRAKGMGVESPRRHEFEKDEAARRRCPSPHVAAALAAQAAQVPGDSGFSSCIPSRAADGCFRPR